MRIEKTRPITEMILRTLFVNGHISLTKSASRGEYYQFQFGRNAFTYELDSGNSYSEKFESMGEPYKKYPMSSGELWHVIYNFTRGILSFYHDVEFSFSTEDDYHAVVIDWSIVGIDHKFEYFATREEALLNLFQVLSYASAKEGIMEVWKV